MIIKEVQRINLSDITDEAAKILIEKGWVANQKWSIDNPLCSDRCSVEFTYTSEVEVADDIIIDDDKKEEQKQEDTTDPAADTTPATTEPAAATTQDATTTEPAKTEEEVKTEPEVKF